MLQSMRDCLVVVGTSAVYLHSFTCLTKLSRTVTVALFPGLPTVQFLIACSTQKWREEAWYRENDVNVYL